MVPELDTTSTARRTGPATIAATPIGTPPAPTAAPPGATSGRPIRAGYGYSYSSGPGVYPGAYGRPDLVYPGGGSAYDRPAYGRDARRVDWCRSVYRSYDRASGYYRTYDGRLVFCG